MGYEVRNAGFELPRPLVAGTTVDTSDEYEEILLDPLKRPDEPPMLTFPILQVFVPSSRPTATLRVEGERYAVVDSAMQPQAASMSYFEARAAARASGLGDRRPVRGGASDRTPASCRGCGRRRGTPAR